jgi:hypothetical protein
MNDTIFLSVVGIISLLILVLVVYKAIGAWKSRPLELRYKKVEIIPINSSISASEVSLSSSVDLISSKFSEILGNEK